MKKKLHLINKKLILFGPSADYFPQITVIDDDMSFVSALVNGYKTFYGRLL